MSAENPSLREWCWDFSPGLLDTPESDRLPNGATPDAYNAEFDKVYFTETGERRATMRKRRGARLINPTTMSSGAKVDGLFEFRRVASASKLLAVCNGALYQHDDIDAFAAVSGGTGFTAGRTARATFFRSNAFVHDGAQMKRYDGTTVFDVGFVKPSSVTDMTVVAPSGAGVTGTYESYYVWYDSVMDHESSPSATTIPVVFTADARRHTKPGGSPPVNVTHWRIYVRRTDTNEFNFFRAGTVLVATATSDEEVTDAARREAGAGPYSADNDPPPGAFAVLEERKGIGFGILPNDDTFYVSKVGDLESWNPRNRFPVSRGDGEMLTTVKKYGTDILLQKPHSTIRLVGTTVPFEQETLHTKWGNVSQDAGLEVDSEYYAWDRVKGPYVTDTVNWTSMVDGRIAAIVATVSRDPDALADIRANYDETNRIIRWAVPVIGSTRKRMILPWHVDLKRWLPPTTGLEYGSLATYTTPLGALGTYMGDYWGRVYELGSGDRDGVPGASSGAAAVGPIAVTSATTGTVTASGASFYTTGSGLAGMSCAVVSPSGTWQWRRIASNTGTVLTLDTTNDNPWTTVPDSTYSLIVAGIRWYWTTPWLDFKRPEIQKDLWHFFLQGKAASSSYNTSVHGRYNDEEGVVTSTDFTFPTGTLSGVWGTMLWGTGLWSTTTRRMRKQSVGRNPFTAQFQFSNYYPDQPITITGWGLTADPIDGRKNPGASQ